MEIVRLWDVATGRPLGLPLSHSRKVESVDFSADGELIVTASEDGAARVWQVRTGQLVGEPMRHSRPKSEDMKTVYSASFSPDGLRIVTAALDGTARIWDAACGQPLGSPLPHGGPVHAARFSPDGQRVTTASEDGIARLWDVPTGTKGEEDLLASWAETAGGYLINATGAAVPIDEAPKRLARLREQAALPVGEPGSVRNLLRWFLTDPARRTISPISNVKTQQIDPSQSQAP
jgi:WD40 repeat protein